MTFEKIILVTRETRLEGLVERFNTARQARFYIEHAQGDFNLYEQEHSQYHTQTEQLERELRKLLKVHVIDREYLPNYLFTPQDLVVTIGVDGLVVNTAKYLSGQPIVAVNPDPAHIDGVLLPFDTPTAIRQLPRILEGQYETDAISMAEASLNDGQRLLAFNDLFVGVENHTSARYELRHGQQQETQSSSGLIIATGAGSSGWLSSFFNFTRGMLHSLGGPDTLQVGEQLPWDADTLTYIVREPFISKTSGAGMVFGHIRAGEVLEIESHMPEKGVIFSDGITSDFLQFNSGATASIRLAGKKTNLIRN